MDQEDVTFQEYVGSVIEPVQIIKESYEFEMKTSSIKVHIKKKIMCSHRDLTRNRASSATLLAKDTSSHVHSSGHDISDPINEIRTGIFDPFIGGIGMLLYQVMRVEQRLVWKNLK